MRLRVARLLSVVVLFSTACVDSYRTVGPMSKRAALHETDLAAFYAGLVRIEFDSMYLMLLRDPIVRNGTIVGIEPRYGKRWSMPLSRVTAVQTSKRDFIDKLVAIDFGLAPVSLGGGWLRINARR